MTSYVFSFSWYGWREVGVDTEIHGYAWTGGMCAKMSNSIVKVGDFDISVFFAFYT